MSIIGHIEIFGSPLIPSPESKAEGAGVPPGGRTAVGSGFSGNGDLPPVYKEAFQGEGDWSKQPTDQELNAGIFWGFHNEIGKEIHDPTYDSPLLQIVNRVLDKHLGELTPEPVGKERFQAYIKKLDEAGVIKKRPGMSFRRFIGLILPHQK